MSQLRQFSGKFVEQIRTKRQRAMDLVHGEDLFWTSTGNYIAYSWCCAPPSLNGKKTRSDAYIMHLIKIFSSTLTLIQ